MSFRVVNGSTHTEAGWRCCNRDECDIVRIPGLTLVDTAPIRKGAPLTILGAWLFWYDRNVEEITSPVWGWSATNDVLGGYGKNNGSNHLAGVAVDIMAPKYPWGLRRRTPAINVKIQEGLRLFEGSVFDGARWNKPDEMHFQCAWPEGDPRNEAFAAKLRGGYLGIYGGSQPSAPASKADGYALAIIREGQRRGITPRGIQIALSTALVESGMKMYANSKVPASMLIPHDAVGTDHDSVGLFQQRCPMWGPAAVLMDPTQSAGLFYDRLVKLDYNSPARPAGDYAADVQRPAAKYRYRYQERMPDAVQLYNRLSTPSDPWEELLMSNPVDSWSIYATPGEPPIPPIDLLRAIDAKVHRDLTDEDARAGDPEAIRRVARTAAGLGKYRTPGAIAHAVSVLNEINASRPEAILAATPGKA